MTTTSHDADEVMLTEAGWCERCRDDWNNEDNGCKSMRSEKEDNCNYSSSSSDSTTSSDTTTTTTTSHDADEVMLTEAGWCERCRDDWNNEDNGCKSMRS